MCITICRRFFQTREIHYRHPHVPLCRKFTSHSVNIARYASLIWVKFPTNCDAHLSGRIFKHVPIHLTCPFAFHIYQNLNVFFLTENNCIPYLPRPAAAAESAAHPVWISISSFCDGTYTFLSELPRSLRLLPETAVFFPVFSIFFCVLFVYRCHKASRSEDSCQADTLLFPVQSADSRHITPLLLFFPASYCFCHISNFFPITCFRIFLWFFLYICNYFSHNSFIF